MRNTINRILAAGLSLTMLIPSIAPVMAKNVDSARDDSQSTQVKYEVGSHYKWTIHSAIDFGADAGPNTTIERAENNQVKVLENVIPENYYLYIRVKNKDKNGKLVLTNGKSEKLLCDVGWKDKDVSWGNSLIRLAAGKNTVTQEMMFRLNTKKSSAEVAGNYNGTVVYEATVEKPGLPV